MYEIADWASANGYSMLEIACWPAAEGAIRRYSGVCHIDCAALTDTQATEIVGELAARGITISGLGYHPNPLTADLDARAASHTHLCHVFAAAAKLGVPVVNTFIGADQQLSQTANIAEMAKVWPDLVRAAADSGVKIGIENCPMIFTSTSFPRAITWRTTRWCGVAELLDERRPCGVSEDAAVVDLCGRGCSNSCRNRLWKR